jgi:hypothetical protein
MRDSRAGVNQTGCLCTQRAPQLVDENLESAPLEPTPSNTGSLGRTEGLLARLRKGAQVRLDGCPATGEEGLCFFIGNGSTDDDIVAIFPVNRGGNLELGGELQRIDNAEDLIEIPAC